MDSLDRDTERLIEIYMEFSNIEENNKLKNRLRIDFLDQFDRIESPNEVDFYTLGLFIMKITMIILPIKI